MPRKVAADSWSGSGSTTSQWMVFDSLSNEVIAVAEDHFEKSVIGFLFCYSCNK